MLIVREFFRLWKELRTDDLGVYWPPKTPAKFKDDEDVYSQAPLHNMSKTDIANESTLSFELLESRNLLKWAIYQLQKDEIKKVMKRVP